MADKVTGDFVLSVLIPVYNEEHTILEIMALFSLEGRGNLAAPQHC